MRVVQRTGLFVAAVEIGFPLSMLAWRSFVFEISPQLAERFPTSERLLTLLLAPTTILVWATWHRLRHGPPPWPRGVVIVLVQLTVIVVTQFQANTTILNLLLGCTILVTLPPPWAFPLIGVAILTGIAVNWISAWPAMLGLVLHNLLACAVLYAVVRMGELAVALRRAQDLLAGLAVDQERIRVARELHDKLGQELTAAGLRAELAARLMPQDPGRAAMEIKAVQTLTEQALDGVRQVARSEWQPDFDNELSTGTALLESAGVRCRIEITALPDERIGRVVGWALREGITNVLKHSSARTCLLKTEIREGVFRMTAENDGASGCFSVPGSGLSIIADRVHELGGHAWSGPAGGDRFRLLVELPIR
ncbi:histidine kinase [Amycolatopsis sp. NPDC004079]|uniref:sensor histidine kinase n=1 Tax=Amycolatopsis sp. NPDC004079 TaxID=3154549 RepID=UPI0033B44A59